MTHLWCILVPFGVHFTVSRSPCFQCSKSSEYRANVRVVQMFRSILAHLSFNFYRSCQADYRHALYRSSARLFVARISPASRPEFSYGYSVFLSVVLTYAGIFLRGLKLSGEGQT